MWTTRPSSSTITGWPQEQSECSMQMLAWIRRRLWSGSWMSLYDKTIMTPAPRCSANNPWDSVSARQSCSPHKDTIEKGWNPPMPSCHLTGVHHSAVGLFRVIITTKTLFCLFALTSGKIDSLRTPQHLTFLHSQCCIVPGCRSSSSWALFGIYPIFCPSRTWSSTGCIVPERFPAWKSAAQRTICKHGWRRWQSHHAPLPMILFQVLTSVRLCKSSRPFPG